MEKVYFDKGTHNAWYCPDKTPHEWLYRKDRKEYMCHKCGLFIIKQVLKEETE